MKNKLFLLVCLFAFVLTFSGCKETPTETPDKTVEKTPTEEKPTTTPEPEKPSTSETQKPAVTEPKFTDVNERFPRPGVIALSGST